MKVFASSLWENLIYFYQFSKYLKNPDVRAQETPCLEIGEEKISKKVFVCYARGVARVYIGEGTLSLLLIIIFSLKFFHFLPFCMSKR